MNDYSKFFENPESYITSIDVNPKNSSKFTVTYSGGIRCEYELTRENLKAMYKRIEDQYLKIINNKRLIFSNKKINTTLIGLILSAIGSFIFCVTSGTVTDPLILTAFGAVSLGVTGIGLNSAINSSKRNVFTIYETFLKNLQDIEQAAKNDKNILSGINKESTKILDAEKELASKGLTESEFSVNSMDKISISELKKILHQYKIYLGLQQKVELNQEIYKGSRMGKSRVKRKNK